MVDPKEDPTFEVATVKPSPSEPRSKGIRIVGRRLSGTNQTLNDFITFSYGVHVEQITGGPPWLASDLFDVLAQTAGEGQPRDQQWKVMVRKLIADRFKLAFHLEKRELSVFTLLIASGKPKLTPSTDDPNGVPSLAFTLGTVVARDAGMADFAFLLQDALMDRPVLDQTRLTGKFDFALRWTPDEFQLIARGMKPSSSADRPDAPPDFSEAMREQLGLRLQSAKAPADVIVIDHVEKPSPN